MRAGVRSDHLQTAEAFRRARDGSLSSGWSHRDPELLVAQGETAGLFRLAAEHVLPSLPGLRDRLEAPGARFLDVGAGVGVLSTELCLVYPEVSAACLEPNATARGIGRERCLEAGLDDRIEFLSHGIEELRSERRLRPRADPAALPASGGLRGRARAGQLTALRPGGWLIVLALDLPESEPLVAASRRIRARLWGGGAVQPDELLDGLGRVGYENGRAHPPVGAYRMFAAQRPAESSVVPPLAATSAS